MFTSEFTFPIPTHTSFSLFLIEIQGLEIPYLKPFNLLQKEINIRQPH